MYAHAEKRVNHLWIYLFIALAVLLLSARVAGANGPVGIVYYQATYSDGRVRDLNEPPDTNEGIRGVLRITRYSKGLKSYEVYTTEGPAVRKVNTGITDKVQLRWNGEAWVAPHEQASGGDDDAPASRPDPVRQEISRIEAVLKGMKNKLPAADHAVARAQREVGSAEDEKAKAAAEARLEKAKARRKDLLGAIEQYASALRALKSLQDQPAGRVETLDEPPGEETGNDESSRPKHLRTLPGRVYVHKLPAARGQRRYTVSAPHAEAGRCGAFYFMVYADTDGDGAPDKIVSCSPPAQVNRPGLRSRWSFSTSHRQVYLGRSFVHPEACQYAAGAHARGHRGRRGHKGATGGGTTEVYVSPALGVLPHKWRGDWPYYSNIYVRVDQGSDENEYTGPQIIIR